MPGPGLDRSAFGVRLALVFCLLLFAAVWAGRLPSAILALYLASSGLTFLLYALDKSAARNHRRRIRERTLHFWGFCAGWPGALVASSLLRHKSSKPAFQSLFWLTVLANCLMLGWLLTPRGKAFLSVLV